MKSYDDYYYNRALKKSNRGKRKNPILAYRAFSTWGGDSEWFINYPRPIIGKKCDETMTIF